MLLPCQIVGIAYIFYSSSRRKKYPEFHWLDPRVCYSFFISFLLNFHRLFYKQQNEKKIVSILYQAILLSLTRFVCATKKNLFILSTKFIDNFIITLLFFCLFNDFIDFEQQFTQQLILNKKIRWNFKNKTIEKKN